LEERLAAALKADGLTLPPMTAEARFKSFAVATLPKPTDRRKRMSDTFISVKIPTLVDASALHVGSSDTAADTLSLRITDGVTNMTRQRIFPFLRP
jgi:hypothetical protein